MPPTATTITNANLFDFTHRLRSAKSTNGLTSVKLHRIRKALADEASVVAKAFEEIDRAHALLDEAGEPMLQKSDDLSVLSWKATGTPAYECDPEKADARIAAMTELEEGTVTLQAPQLTDVDLAQISAGDEAAAALAAFAAPL